MVKIKSINFASIYVEDYNQALSFYQKHFGYEVKSPMGDNASWGKAGEAAIYLEGGNKPVAVTEKSIRVSVVFNVASASVFFDQLKSDGVRLIQSEPLNMGADDYWFQFRDPAGNILEILGGK